MFSEKLKPFFSLEYYETTLLKINAKANWMNSTKLTYHKERSFGVYFFENLIWV